MRIAIVSLLLVPVFAAENREAAWQEDLKFLETEFSGHQKDFGKLYPRFHEEMAALLGEVGKLTDAQVAMRVMKMVASANVSHTTVYMPGEKLGFHALPVSMGWYSEGLVFAGATPPYKEAQGARVMRIGSMTPEQFMAAVAPYVAHENEVHLKQQSPAFMQMPCILKEVGAIDTEESVVFTLQKPGGEPFKVTVTPGNPDDKRVPMFEALNLPAVLNRKQPAAYYWYEYLPDSRAIYLQYNRCNNDPNRPFADFAKEVLEFMDSHPVKRMVLDLRLNGGGNSRVIEPLKSGLKRRKLKIFVLIGPRTFSSAQLGAMDFRRELHATLVGEATSEKPNSYGEVRPITLPNSGLTMQYSTKFFQFVSGDPAALEPDIRAPRSLADAFAGRDAALEAALRR